MLSYIQAYMEYRKTVRELSQLSDRELRDIGITRCEIRGIGRPEHFSFRKWFYELIGRTDDPIYNYLSRSTDFLDLERRFSSAWKRP